MKIAIIGAGSLGSVYGSLLCSSEHEIILLTRREEHAHAINVDGICIKKIDGRSNIYHPFATTNREQLISCNLHIILVKTINLLETTNLIAKYSDKNSHVMVLMNGLGNIELLKEKISPSRIIAGVSYIAAERVDDNNIILGNNLNTIIGELSGIRSYRINSFSNLFNRIGIQTRITSNINKKIWEKLALVSTQSALGALLGFTTSQLFHSDYSVEIMNKLLSEVIMIAQHEGISLPSNLLDKFLRNSNLLPNHKSSMLQDLENHRKTEIDMINGKIVNLGIKHGVETPYNKLMTLLIHAAEDVP